MQKIKNLLNLIPITNYEEWFSQIAELLFTQYQIKTAANEYQLTEIEFYYYSKEHNDETTYGFIKEGIKYSDRILRHKKAQQNQLTWFFHYSGIDIVFGNIGNPGGILIRAIRNIETGENITGPLVVSLELLNQQTNVESSLPFNMQLFEVEIPFEITPIKSKPRIGISVGNYAASPYHYSITSFSAMSP
ncbi:MAG: hypothetical protein ABJB05_12250 [Parafilimonas sp.]